MSTGNTTSAPKIAARSTLITSKFAGQCACGAKFAAGASVAWSRSYDHPIVGCAECDFGTFAALTRSDCLDEAQHWMMLANNAINMRAAKNTARCLTRNSLAAAAARDGRA